MNFESNDCLPVTHSQAPEPSNPKASSSALAIDRIEFSLNAGPAICSPVGSPSLSPFGIETAGIPASDIGTVQKSLRYISSGSAVLDPSSKATHGLVGVTIASNCWNAASKSREIRVLTFWALP